MAYRPPVHLNALNIYRQQATRKVMQQRYRDGTEQYRTVLVLRFPTSSE